MGNCSGRPYWDKPTRFMPERFMGSEVDYRGQHFWLLLFGSPCSEGVENLDMNDVFGLALLRETPLLAVPKKLS
ncbi:unnamed protein product [Ilex paraguariensis]|uniref:Uncharacterized protein n=1 Tax=Ilex paraguariensis TaxID=185542 RepID=A0ABC8TUF8_9AQUA